MLPLLILLTLVPPATSPSRPKPSARGTNIPIP